MSDIVYPPTIDAHVEIRATGERIPLVARRTGETEDGCEVYRIQALDGGPIPCPGSWLRDGRIALGIDFMPGRSSMQFAFAAEEPS